MSALEDRVRADLAPALPVAVSAAARTLAEGSDVAAVLFYGSVLRTERLEDLLDFYVLTDGPERAPFIWPRVTFREIRVGTRIVRAKVATMPLSVFTRAAEGRLLDTTIWTRFCQPCALAWSRDEAAGHAVVHAVSAAIVTAAGYAAVLGPKGARAEDYWAALFDCTYHTEFRVEAPGRSATIVAHAPDRYTALLPLAWQAAGIGYREEGGGLEPVLRHRLALDLADGWWRRAAVGKALNIIRLLKAAFTFDGAGRYALWKIERHTGIAIEATPWREAHPVLAAPGVLWQIYRARRRPRVLSVQRSA
jgi:hypothetical protein